MAVVVSDGLTDADEVDDDGLNAICSDSEDGAAVAAVGAGYRKNSSSLSIPFSFATLSSAVSGRGNGAPGCSAASERCTGIAVPVGQKSGRASAARARAASAAAAVARDSRPEEEDDADFSSAARFLGRFLCEVSAAVAIVAVDAGAIV